MIGHANLYIALCLIINEMHDSLHLTLLFQHLIFEKIFSKLREDASFFVFLKLNLLQIVHVKEICLFGTNVLVQMMNSLKIQ